MTRFEDLGPVPETQGWWRKYRCKECGTELSNNPRKGVLQAVKHYLVHKAEQVF